LPKIVDLTSELVADRAVGVRGLHIAEVEVAVVHGVVLQKTRGNDVEVGHDIRE
jgi:hypothetical protein